MEAPNFKLTTVSSLEKIFPETAPAFTAVQTHGTMLLNERYSFQAVYCLERALLKNVTVHAEGALADQLILRQVRLMPSDLPNGVDADSHVLRSAPGLYPDLLEPIPADLSLYPGQWRSIWVTLPAECTAGAGCYEIKLVFTEDDGTVLGSCVYHLERIHARLPEQDLIHTQWFHTDCISDWYHAPVFGDEYWHWVDLYMKAASTYGINMLLTPIFTPPLDTQIGSERLTVQLVDVWRTPGQGTGEVCYSFGFERLETWISYMDKNSIRYIEFSHLFTQWGAGHAPKIMARSGCPTGKTTACEERIFGWETDASSSEYAAFLKAFLSALLSFIREHKLEKRCYFHISDEPSLEQLPHYLEAKKLVDQAIEGLPVMDAISDYELYEQGNLDNPVCSNNHMEPFLEHHVENLWTYYCCAQCKDVSNRFFCMPSARNRIIGLQLYRYNIKGFLQWGFNFYYSYLSRYKIDPYKVTDAGGGFPSGDAFLVYPGQDGPLASLRAEVFLDALQDLRCLKLLESLKGREFVLRYLEEQAGMDITFTEYPRDASWLTKLRGKINELVRP